MDPDAGAVLVMLEVGIAIVRSAGTLEPGVRLQQNQADLVAW
jgi:hypothetical protein